MAKGQARLIFALLIFTLLASLAAMRAANPPPNDPAPAAKEQNVADVLLYQQIVEGMRAGGDYYLLAAQGQRQNNYPMRPFFTMRLPTLAAVLASLPRWAGPLLLWVLCAAMLVAWWRRSADWLVGVRPRIILMALLGGSAMVCFDRSLIWFHEIWAGLLIALALAVWRPGRWQAAAGCALMAMLVRETAALFPLIMGAIALAEGRRREAAGWAAMIAVLAVAVAFHAAAWHRVVMPEDPASPGWLGMLGVGFFIKTMTLVTALALFPGWVAMPLVVLALFGWTSLRDPLGWRAIALFAAYITLMAIFCRVDTFYWAMLAAPPLLPGLAFAIDGARDLAKAAIDRRKITVRRVTP